MVYNKIKSIIDNELKGGSMLRRISLLRFLLSLVFVVLISGLTSVLQAGDLEVGKSYHGFKLTRQENVKELDALVQVFEHEKTGACLVKVKDDDPNNTFVINFQTVPTDDTGVAHIMEHSVLNGSTKYPVKSPFDILRRGSLNTFLNALTASDCTMYPIASQNDKDFFNLMDIYLDAVLFPRIKDEPRIFKREGWHYALETADSELVINGIVYNEMKGAYSTPTRQMDYYINKTLFPDNTYGYSSGGFPEAIPGLTYEKFLEFHRKFYHPSNSFIFLHGDGDVLAELKHIDDNFLSKFEKSPYDTRIPVQKPFSQPREMVADYEIAANESEENNTWLNYSVVTNETREYDVTIALQIIADILVDKQAAPVRRALVAAGIGKEVSGNLDQDRQNTFVVQVQGANEADKDKFKAIVLNTLKEHAQKGLDKKMIQGALNQLEFQLREDAYPFRGYPKGLLNNFRALKGWQHTGDPLYYLKYEKTLETLRTGLKTDYYEKILEKYVINNPHALLMVMRPKKGISEAREKELKEKLAKRKAGLSQQEITQLVADTQSLKKYQEEPDSPEALKSIPVLSLADVDAKATYYQVGEREIDGVKVLVYPTFTNGIIYTQVLFDASSVPQDLIPYASLLTYMLGDLSTKNYSYGDLDTVVDLYTGGIRFNLNTYNKDSDPNQPMLKIEMNGKVLPGEIDKLMELEAEIIQGTLFEDRARLKELIIQMDALYEMYVQRSGETIAMNRLRSYFSASGQIEDLKMGLSAYRVLSELSKNFDSRADEIIEKMKKVAELVFNKKNLIVAVTCAEEHYPLLEKKLPILFKALGNRELQPVKYSFNLKPIREGLQTTSRVQYVIKGYDYKALGYTYTGKYNVLEQILNGDYLQRKIRIVGGAYGRFVAFPRSGIAYLGSYRDPQLTKTLEAFDLAGKYLETLEVDDREMTRYILGTISRKDRPLRPQERGNRAMSDYLENITAEAVQKERDEILSTTLDDIKKMSKLVDDLMKKNCYCVYGNEKTLEDNKALFDTLLKIML